MPAPTVSSISPRIGGVTGGSTVTITGTNFTGATGVTIGGVAATGLVVVNATTITCVTPTGSEGTASVLVTNPSGTNGANSLFIYIPNVPADTYIYLKGGRGDAFVPLWTGEVTQEETTEKGEPYRNSVAGTTTSTGVIGNPGYLNVIEPAAQPFVIGAPVGPVHFNTTLIMDDQLQDAKDGSCPPRTWSKTVTWLVFVSANSLSYKFRKADVLGWGSNPRD